VAPSKQRIAGEGWDGTCPPPRNSRAVKHEDVVVRIHRNSGNLAKNETFGQNRPSMNDRVGFRRLTLLGNNRHGNKTQKHTAQDHFSCGVTKHDQAPNSQRLRPHGQTCCLQ